MVGLVSYGTYIPKYRIKTSDIASVWGKNPADIASGLGVSEKSVPAIDEDAVTIALEATHGSLRTFGGNVTDIEALFVGSESHPYAVNPTSTIVGELLGMGHNYLASDLEFACKAGTAGIEAVAGLIESDHIQYGLAVGTDAAQSKTHDALEYTSASAGVALLLGKKNVAVKLLAYTSYSSDTPDFWRRDGIKYPSHAGRFSGEPAYFAHIMGSLATLGGMVGCSPSDVDYCVFHMPNGKFPRVIAKRLGFSGKQLAPSLTVDTVGNPYSASAMLGFSAVLDVARPGQKILMASYGSGAGSDAFLWEVTDRIVEIQKKRKKLGILVADQIAKKTYVNYAEYLRKTHKI